MIFLVKHYTPEQYYHCGSIYISHCYIGSALLILSELQKKKKRPLAATLQEPKAVKLLNAKNICYKDTGKSLFTIQIRTTLQHSSLVCVRSYGPLYFYITSFSLLIKKALIFYYSYNVHICTTAIALHSPYSPDLLNTLHAISCNTVISPPFPVIELVILLYHLRNSHDDLQMLVFIK